MKGLDRYEEVKEDDGKKSRSNNHNQDSSPLQNLILEIPWRTGQGWMKDSQNPPVIAADVHILSLLQKAAYFRYSESLLNS